MKRLLVEPFKNYEKASYYTIHFEGQELCETDRFIQRFMLDATHQDDLQIIKYWIEKMGRENGTQERYFRPERRAAAIPIVSSGLRLYCIRVSDELTILGNGGIKTSQAVQDCPDLYPAFSDINNVHQKLMFSIRRGDTRRDGRILEGHLEFEIDD